jgi:hypothetical protein
MSALRSSQSGKSYRFVLPDDPHKGVPGYLYLRSRVELVDSDAGRILSLFFLDGYPLR